MESLLFGYASWEINSMTVLFLESLRKFGGIFAEASVKIANLSPNNWVSEKIRTQIENLNGEIVSIIPEDVKYHSLFTNFVQGAAQIEEIAKNETKILTWLGQDTLILNQPDHFILPPDKKLGYRPVHHKNIGALYNAPLSPFWSAIYTHTNVLKENCFPMNTHVDDALIYPYFNAGCICIRPELLFFQKWWKTFKNLYEDSELNQLLENNQANAIFFHQALLSGLILSEFPRDSLIELPFTYNYPLHLHPQNKRSDKPKDLNQLVTVRYENLSVLHNAKFDESLKEWIQQSIHQNN